MGWKRNISKGVNSIRRAGKSAGRTMTKNVGKVGQPLGHAIDDAVGGVVHKAFAAVENKVEREAAKATPGLMLLGSGMAITLIAGLLLSLAAVQALVDVARLAPWAAYLLVGVFLAIIGSIIIWRGKTHFD